MQQKTIDKKFLKPKPQSKWSPEHKLEVREKKRRRVTRQSRRINRK